MSEKFTSEILPSGITIEALNSSKVFKDTEPLYVIEDEQGYQVHVTKADIARMYGIAYPEKRNGCCKVDMPKEGPLNSTNKIH